MQMSDFTLLTDYTLLLFQILLTVPQHKRPEIPQANNFSSPNSKCVLHYAITENK